MLFLFFKHKTDLIPSSSETASQADKCLLPATIGLEGMKDKMHQFTFLHHLDLLTRFYRRQNVRNWLNKTKKTTHSELQIMRHFNEQI